MSSSQTVRLAAALIMNGDKVLLSAHGPKWRWHLPDGEIFPGERASDAVVRAIREDFGAEARCDDAPFMAVEAATADARRLVIIYYQARLENGSAEAQNEKMLSHYFSEKEVPGENLARPCRRVLQTHLGWKV